ncbi:MAG TPA: DUF262 domain-containing HNH endonuclease family protein [Patescibacteria group bacterium]|nr:DUF262 domain-containing HNH endonuclease family protein [Patescibacteria group bacterium]
MKIIPTTHTIGQFFHNPTEQFFIPAYQRRYAWRDSQLDALFNDVNQLKDGDTHLLGALVLLADTHTPSINRLEVVDGQQRITTLCLLLKILRDNLVEKEEHADIVMEINKYLSCEVSDKKERKLVLGDLDAEDYRKIMDNQIGVELENERLKGALDFLDERVKALGQDTPSFYRKLTNQVELIRLDIGQAKDAYKLFETINNRGLKLSAADIIKNFLLGHASLLDEDTLKEVKVEWRQLVLELDKLDYSDMDRFFRQYLMGKIRLKVPKSRLVEEFKNYYYLNVQEAQQLSDYQARVGLIGKKSGRRRQEISEAEEYDENDTEDIAKFNLEVYQQKKLGIKPFANELKKHGKIYQSLIKAEHENPKVARRLIALKKIEALPAYTFLVNLIWRGVEDKELIKILDLIECFLLRRQVCGYRTSELDDIFPRLCALSQQDTKDIADKVKEEFMEGYPRDEEFLEKFPYSNYRGAEERAKYILSKIELHLQGDSAEVDIRGGREVQLEHIIPQTISGKKAREEEGGDWREYLGGERIGKDKVRELHKKYLNRIGNLTILAEKQNIKASNNPFRAKVNEYKKSVFRLNKDLVDNYKKFKFSEVDKRSDWLAEYAVKIWKF